MMGILQEPEHQSYYVCKMVIESLCSQYCQICDGIELSQNQSVTLVLNPTLIQYKLICRSHFRRGRVEQWVELCV